MQNSFLKTLKLKKKIYYNSRSVFVPQFASSNGIIMRNDFFPRNLKNVYSIMTKLN